MNKNHLPETIPTWVVALIISLHNQQYFIHSVHRMSSSSVSRKENTSGNYFLIQIYFFLLNRFFWVLLFFCLLFPCVSDIFYFNLFFLCSYKLHLFYRHQHHRSRFDSIIGCIWVSVVFFLSCHSSVWVWLCACVSMWQSACASEWCFLCEHSDGFIRQIYDPDNLELGTKRRTSAREVPQLLFFLSIGDFFVCLFFLLTPVFTILHLRRHFQYPIHLSFRICSPGLFGLGSEQFCWVRFAVSTQLDFNHSHLVHVHLFMIPFVCKKKRWAVEVWLRPHLVAITRNGLFSFFW